VDPGSITEGECTYLYWEVLGTVSQVRIFRNAQSIWDTAPAKYGLTECPEGVSIVTYELQASGPAGTVREVRQLIIYPKGSAPPLTEVEQLPYTGGSGGAP
jgi:hypothetical protein